MRTLFVVDPEPSFQAPTGCQPVAVIVEVYVLILHAAPQPLDEPVVHPTATAIHAHFHTGRLHRVDVPGTRELRPLVGVGNQRRTARVLQSSFTGSNAKLRLHRVAQLPRQHIPAPPIHHRHQIHKPYAIGTYVMSLHHTWLGPLISNPFSKYG